MNMKEKIFEIAQRLIQQRGVNGFSYADIAKEVGVSKPSLHHHFATKTDLIARLMERYTEQLTEYLESRTNLSAQEALNAYFNLYRQNIENERVCMGGMLSTEVLTLDPCIHPLLSRFFNYQQEWLTAILKKGQSDGELKLTKTAEQQACLIIAALQGALIISRAAGNSTFFNQSITGLYTELT
ncbi:TetR/AcrR family transcriptional regulator [Neptuniibacter pectenicola]|uniref:TetR/AcrR family transcriptional regulator n=1 Tax=Neptuniibacter pectenicola TaxID=1806669 RepID=UPI00082B176D|nr:TetR/AcrR family transcriptional regulator [Neptuniibacter pectenicola]